MFFRLDFIHCVFMRNLVLIIFVVGIISYKGGIVVVIYWFNEQYVFDYVINKTIILRIIFVPTSCE